MGVSTACFRGGRGRARRDSLSVGLAVQRLFSTFPGGLPGAGLVILRVLTAVPLVHAGALTASSPSPSLVTLVASVAALLVLLGLWTPIAGAVIAVMELGLAWSHPDDPWAFLHFAVLAGALALLGPGRWSVDARLFGRKHIQIPER
jgi:putative oxidoreductase